MPDLSEERIAKNNETFREANEKIRARADEYDPPMERFPFICECASEDCMQIVRLTSDQYAAVRANPAHFLTAVGHEGVEEPVGRVFSREDGYLVVEKDLGD
jgi:hypothetical protein